jgi:predicted AlkP superfamily pyrophosphatase or phosphodiesterase
LKILFKSVRAIVAVVLGISCSILWAQVHRNRTVVLISLDGFPSYALDDPRLPIPTIRKLAREGAIANSMRPVNPTVTWPNHTALVTGVDASKHDVLFNGLLIRPTNGTQPSVEPWRDKDVLVHAPTIYDIAYRAGLTTAQVDWVAIYGAKTITWKFPELPDPEGPLEREMIADGTVTAEQLRTFEDSSQAWQDQIWTDAAVKILKRNRPNLLLFHLLTGDDTNHEYGPMSPASFTAMAWLDACVMRIIEALRDTNLQRKTTVMIVSDHGFRGIKHKIHPNVLLREKGLISGKAEQARGESWVASTGGTAMVYVSDPKRKAELIPELTKIFAHQEGVARVYGPDDIGQLGLPRASETDQGPDLVLCAAPDYSFGNESEGNYVTQVAQGGTHGYLNTDPSMQAMFVAWGAEIIPGVRLNKISNLDVAPTIAAILGVEMEKTQGHVLHSILREKAGK